MVEKFAIIIPAFNEEATIGQIVEKTFPYGIIIVVDDASTDETSKIAKKYGAKVVRHPNNLGYDGALNSGFAEAVRLGCRYAVTVDADGQHDLSLIENFSEALKSVPLVFGVRPSKQRFAEKIFSFFTHWRYGIRDPLCGMKGYQLELYQSLGHFDSYGSIGTELALFGVRKGIRFIEINVPIRSRVGAPRFDSLIRANIRILRALFLGILKEVKF